MRLTSTNLVKNETKKAFDDNEHYFMMFEIASVIRSKEEKICKIRKFYGDKAIMMVTAAISADISRFYEVHNHSALSSLSKDDKQVKIALDMASCYKKVYFGGVSHNDVYDFCKNNEYGDEYNNEYEDALKCVFNTGLFSGTINKFDKNTPIGSCNEDFKKLLHELRSDYVKILKKYNVIVPEDMKNIKLI